MPVKYASRRGEEVDLVGISYLQDCSVHLDTCFLAVERVLIRQHNNAPHSEPFASAHTLEREAQVSVGW